MPNEANNQPMVPSTNVTDSAVVPASTFTQLGHPLRWMSCALMHAVSHPL
jgi:hypothetical protein